MKITDIGEFNLIKRIHKRLTVNTRSVILGIGDDTAIVRPQPGRLQLFTTDMMVEGIHFNVHWSKPDQIGWKALAINISDIAAMGGRPLYAVVSIGLPQDTDVKTVDAIISGIRKIARKYNVAVVGGDTVSSDHIVINVAMWGDVKRGYVLKRSNARVGDLLAVTGTYGDSAAGLELFQHKSPIIRSRYPKLIRKHCMPVPRVEEAGIIGRGKLASSMIDSSDGLALSVKFICEASRVGARIYSDRIPLSSSLKRAVSKGVLNDPLNLALYGGEDFELVFTVPKRKENIFKKIAKNINTQITVIGEIVPFNKGFSVVSMEGEIKTIKPRGYEHFRGR